MTWAGGGYSITTIFAAGNFIITKTKLVRHCKRIIGYTIFATRVSFYHFGGEVHLTNPLPN